MKKDIVLAGVGGQGIVSIAAVIGTAAVKAGLNAKQSEVHGMSQRGGDVMSHLRLSDTEIYSDLIPFGKADIILSVEPMESLRYLPMLSKDGWVITNTVPFNNISNYPEMDAVFAELEKQPKHIAIDAEKIAKEIGSLKMANIVILGAASPYIGIEYNFLEEAIRSLFGAKGESVVEGNIKALAKGREFAK